MLRRIVRLGIAAGAIYVAIAAVAPACYHTPEPDCGFRCGPAGDCPTDYTCHADHYCHRNSAPQSLVCGVDAAIDAPADARADARADASPDASPDAGSGILPDAAMPDATMPDAGVPDAAMSDAAIDAGSGTTADAPTDAGSGVTATDGGTAG